MVGGGCEAPKGRKGEGRRACGRRQPTVVRPLDSDAAGGAVLKRNESRDLMERAGELGLAEGASRSRGAACL